MTGAELEERLGMKAAQVARALASYVRTIRSGNSRFDRYTAGKKNALNAIEKAGLTLRCARSPVRRLTMHDGSMATLEDVVEFYSKGGHPNPKSRKSEPQPALLRRNVRSSPSSDR